MSLVNVMKGPVAKAGSMFILFNSNGKAVPKMEAKIITTKRAMVTVTGIAMVGMPKAKVSRKMMEEQMVAINEGSPQIFHDIAKPF